MSSDKHYNPAILQNLRQTVGLRDWAGLTTYLEGLSNARFRTAGYMLGECVMPELCEEDVWELTIVLTQYNSKAFLGTMLKALVERLQRGALDLHSAGGRSFLTLIANNDLDRQKTLLALLPAMKTTDDVQWLLHKTDVEEGRERMACLLRIPTMACGFVLLRTLRFVEHDRVLLVRVAVFLMKRGDGLGFNLASLLRTTYGLEEVKGVFSLHIEPYQLDRLSNSYEAFSRAMKF